MTAEQLFCHFRWTVTSLHQFVRVMASLHASDDNTTLQNVDWWAHFEGMADSVNDVRQAARRYVVARDFGELDPKRADMLWKLQHNK